MILGRDESLQRGTDEAGSRPAKPGVECTVGEDDGAVRLGLDEEISRSEGKGQETVPRRVGPGWADKDGVRHRASLLGSPQYPTRLVNKP